MFGTTWRMPAEWEPHERTWMAFPPSGYLLGANDSEAHTARTVWAKVANAIVDFEPVTMLCNKEDLETARGYLDPRVELMECKLDDAWMRDIGPSFVKGVSGIGVVDPEAEGEARFRSVEGLLGGVNWEFNGWGNQGWANFENDSKVAGKINKAIDAIDLATPLINEGGAIHVNGSDTVLLTKTVQLGEGRNFMWSQHEVEAEIHRKLGTSRAVWFERGLTRDYEEFGTRGHVDMIATFCSEDTVLFHDQQNPEHPDFAVSRNIEKTLQAAGLKGIGLRAPLILRDRHGWVDYNYVNHYVINGAVILCGFNDPNDSRAVTTLQSVYPDRKIIQINATEIFARGGGIHCITQQQPR